MRSFLKHIKQNPILVLRMGGGACFIGHGLLALTAKAKFIALLNTFGIEEQLALSLLKVVGSIDVIVGLFILFKPNRAVLRWAVMWTTLTIVAWGFHGDSLMDLFRRATYLTTPLALLFILYAHKKVQISPIQNSKANDSFVGLTARQEQAINKLDLSMIRMKLMQENGEAWSQSSM